MSVHLSPSGLLKIVLDGKTTARVRPCPTSSSKTPRRTRIDRNTPLPTPPAPKADVVGAAHTGTEVELHCYPEVEPKKERRCTLPPPRALNPNTRIYRAHSLT